MSRATGLAAVQAALGDSQSPIWVDLAGPSEEAYEVLTQAFGFHPLAVEDAYKEGHRPKVEDYERYLYLIVQGLAQAEGWDLKRVELVELDLFVGHRFLVTHHRGRLASIEATKAALETDVELLARGPAYLAHAVLDRLTDRFLPLGPAFDEAFERLEAQILSEDGEASLSEIVRFMSSIQKIRRVLVRQRDVLGRLAIAEFDEIPDEARPFFRDVHEHAGAVVERLETERDELQSLFNAYHSLASHRMNEVMRVLTVISTIVLPLTFLTGVYGMNFDDMPETHWKWGYGFFWGLSLAVTLGTVAFFRLKRWL